MASAAVLAATFGAALERHSTSEPAPTPRAGTAALPQRAVLIPDLTGLPAVPDPVDVSDFSIAGPASEGAILPLVPDPAGVPPVLADPPSQAAPEPSGFLPFLSALISLALLRRRRAAAR